MAEPKFDDDILMAFADGEVDPDMRAAIERAIADDSDIAARVKMFVNTRNQAKAALDLALGEPVPDDLTARIAAMVDAQAKKTAPDTQKVIPLRPKPAILGGFAARYVALPLAASIMLVAGGVAGFFIGKSDPQSTTGVQMVSLDSPQIAGALTTVASGEELSISDQGDRFRAIATFTDADNTLCREFEIEQADQASIVAVACRAGEAWEVQFTVVAGKNPSGYAPASSLQTLDAYLVAIGADQPLSPQAEAAVLAKLR